MTLLAAGSLGLVSGLWIARNDPPETLQIASPRQTETKQDIQQPSAGENQLSRQLEFSDIYEQENIFEQLYFAYSIARASDFERLNELLAVVIRDPDPLFSYSIAFILLEKMVVLDPLSALKFIDTHRTMEQNIFVSHVVTSWVRQDPEAAIDYFKSIRNQQLKYYIGARLLDDPTLGRSGLLAEVELELGSYSEQIVEQVRLRRMPVASAFEEALLRTDNRRLDMLISAAARWYQQDPEAAVQNVAALTNLNERQQLLGIILSMQSGQDPELALQMMEQYAPDDKEIRQQVLMNYANHDPVKALPEIESWVSETGDYFLMSSLISRWVQIDEIAALSYVESIPDQYRQSVVEGLAYAYLEHSPEKGMAWLLTLGPEYPQDVKLSALQALYSYPDIAEDWLTRLDSEPEMQGVLLEQVAQRKAEMNPSDAYEWLERYSDSPQFQAARYSVLQTWAQSDPSTVAALLDDSSSDSAYSGLYSMISGTWVYDDVDAALDWIESIPDSANKEAALGPALSSIQDPERAIALLEELPEDSAGHLKMQVAYHWLSQNPNEVETIIRRLDLNDQDAEDLHSIQEQLLNQARYGGRY